MPPVTTRVSSVGHMKFVISACHPVAKPAYAARLLNAVFRGKAEIAIDVLPHIVCVENHRAQQWRELACQRGLARARQATIRTLRYTLPLPIFAELDAHNSSTSAGVVGQKALTLPCAHSTRHRRRLGGVR